MKKIDDLKTSLNKGRMTRRDFINRMSALGLSAAIPAGLLAQEARASARKVGGRLRQGLSGGSTSDTLFGVLGGGDMHQVNVQWQLLNNLTVVGPDGAIQGDLAESWEASPDAKTWVFKLREGVEFHNGKSFEAADVIHSINQHRGEDSRSTGAGLVAAVSDIQADGKHSVVFTLEEGNADFAAILADYHFPIAPDGSTDADWEKGIGTGPYTLVEWVPGVRAITRRNPNYFKEGPWFDEVETLHIADVVARQSALQTGEVDVIDKPDIKTLHLLEQAKGVQVIELAGNSHYTFPMLMDQAPYDDWDVRMAMKHAIDREAMLETIARGHGYLGNDHPISRSMRFYNDELPQRHYDPDKARHHLKKAGMDSLDVTLSAADIYAGGLDAAQLFQAQAKAGGININIERVSTDGYWSEVWAQVPFCVSFWQGRPTEDLMLTLAFSDKSAWNETRWSNERFEKILLEARAELDTAKRRDMYFELQKIINEDGGLIAPVFSNVITVVNDKIDLPGQMSADLPADGMRNFERWSFK
ncbi:ABC transporter substrate-binding protein [Roseovarius spongiae]|uniref:ABC transporter substrate-binding protein n=1 Tax=Roseovarius spongiae TaxID=2320272 RepID=A0A3A8AY17_9RHOB|nr:ABC transporter substrate-binding protein [Roseovarius spongiae]RKF16807.1 ABC transporter substrate-binding protein [Roseovarius spongiae]